MENEKQYMLTVLSDFLHKRKTANASDLDGYHILELAQSHQIEAILYHQCKSSLPNEVSSRFSQLYASSVNVNEYLSHVTANI